jgi:hypothetical protein
MHFALSYIEITANAFERRFSMAKRANNLVTSLHRQHFTGARFDRVKLSARSCNLGSDVVTRFPQRLLKQANVVGIPVKVRNACD